jgi:hypothetical protein
VTFPIRWSPSLTFQLLVGFDIPVNIAQIELCLRDGSCISNIEILELGFCRSRGSSPCVIFRLLKTTQESYKASSLL